MKSLQELAVVVAHDLVPSTFQPHPVFRHWALHSKIRMSLVFLGILRPVLSLYVL